MKENGLPTAPIHNADLKMQFLKERREYTPLMKEMMALRISIDKWKLDNPAHRVINYKDNIKLGKAYIRWCKKNIGPFLKNWAYMGKKLYIKDNDMYVLLILSMSDYEKR